MNDYLGGKLFHALMASGLNTLQLHRGEVNELNVFPVPDGDTGTNMCMTLKNGVDGITADTDDLKKVAKEFSQSVVLGARGNSGVILSQFLKGMCAYLSAFEKADASQFTQSLFRGVACAYNAVMDPTEGTMLTVLKEATDRAAKCLTKGATVADVLQTFLVQARATLEKTPELLDVLKKAGVVDSGGQGVVYFAEGMLSCLRGEGAAFYADHDPTPTKTYDYSLFDPDTEYVYGYCTEVLTQLKRGKKPFDKGEFSDRLKAVGGSIVMSLIDTKIKIHVHTFTPEKVLALCLEYGELLAVKIENMDVQRANEKPREADASKSATVPLATVVVSPDKKLGGVFCEMGASAIVDGGDTCNPSVSDFIKAFSSVNAEELLVFPNSANVVLTARQAKEAFGGKAVVVNCTSLAECYSTLALVDYAASASENAQVIEDAIKNVATLTVFKAARDSLFDGSVISAGEYVAVEGKTLLFKGSSLTDVVVTAVASYLKKCDKEVVTLFAGKYVNESDLDLIVDELIKLAPFADVITVPTDNPVHEFTISLE